MKSFKKFVESCKPINEAEYNKEWWDSKSDSFKKRYIERHPNSIYAQKAQTSKTTVKERTPEHIDKEISAITSSLGNLMKQPGGASDSVIDGIVSKLAELQREKAAATKSTDTSTKKHQIKPIEQSSKEQDKTSDTKYNNTKASLSKKLGSEKYQQIEDFISAYDVEQYSKAATEYAYNVADDPDDVEMHFDDFDDIYYVNGSELARNIKKKFGFDIPHYDLENILNKVGGNNVVQWETDGSEKSVAKKPSTPKFGPTASKFRL